MTNYIPDENRFQLAGPPAWWLRALREFDSSLVVLPSRQGFFYRLAQRRKPNLATKLVNDLLSYEGDTQMLASYQLVPVTTILATVCWNPYLFEILRLRAPWRLGGHEKVNAMLEAQDMQAEIDKRVKTDEHLTGLSKDGWNLYKKKIGLRSQMWSPTTKAQPGPQRPAPAKRTGS